MARRRRTVSDMARDPDRIDVVLDEIRRVWTANPDLRLSQLVFNAAREGLSDTEAPLPTTPSRLYNIEEPLLLKGLAEF